MKYEGMICPYCKTEFKEGDDIVVCSACEMPHHKECWIENKGCTTFGCTGTVKGPEIFNEFFENELHCPKCGAVYNENQTFCSSCGTRLGSYNGFGDHTQNSDVEYEYDKYITGKDMETFIGPSTLNYYMEQYKRFDEQNTTISWNWAAFLFSSYWFAYRKMYSMIFVVFGASFLFGFITEADDSALTLFSLLLKIACGMFGNYIYIKKAEKQVKKVKYMDEHAKNTYLAKKGGISGLALILVIIFVILIRTISEF